MCDFEPLATSRHRDIIPTAYLSIEDIRKSASCWTHSLIMLLLMSAWLWLWLPSQHARHRVSLTDRKANARGGAADLQQVAAIAEALPLNVRLIANGNVQKHADLALNLESTGADGIMSAEGLLDNPAIFDAEQHGKDRLELALEYLSLAERHVRTRIWLIAPCPSAPPPRDIIAVQDSLNG